MLLLFSSSITAPTSSGNVGFRGLSRFLIIRPGETLPMMEEWSDDPQWVDGETISASDWLVGPTGPDLSESDFDDTLASVLFSGAVFGKQYTLTNVVTTSGGKTRVQSTQLRCVGGPASFAISDTTPDAFSFTDAAGAELSMVTTSAGVTISGLTAAAAITVTGGTYSIDGGSYTSSAGTITDGQTVTARGTSSGSYSTAVNVAVTIGGVSDTYTITTKADPGIGYTPSLVFSDARNSQYIALLEDI